MADEPVDGGNREEGSVPRRRALKRVGQIVAAAAVGLAAGGKTLSAAGGASRPGPRGTRTIRKVTLEATLPSGKKIHFSIPENFPGTITHDGQTFTVVPRVASGDKRLELDIHKGKKVTNSPMQTLSVGIGGATTAAKIESLPLDSFAAFWAGASTVPEDYTPESDCTCYCECPPYFTLTGCACCCDPRYPECGWCWYPPCQYNCDVLPPNE